MMPTTLLESLMLSAVFEMTKRLGWLDTVKAIGIFLVYIGHCDIPSVYPYIYMFHMPLFFIVSGLCWNVERNKDIAFGDFVKKKFNSYIIPYFKVCLICLLLLGIPEAFLQYGASNDFTNRIGKYLFGIVLSRGNTEWMPHCSPVWFLTCLFCAEVLMWLIMKTERERVQYLIVIMAAVLGYVTSLTGKLPWNLDSAFTAIPLLFVGIKIRKVIIEKPIDYRLVSMSILASIMFFVWGVSAVDFDGNYYENMPLMYVSSTAISLTVIMATKLVGGGKFCLLSVRKLSC